MSEDPLIKRIAQWVDCVPRYRLGLAGFQPALAYTAATKLLSDIPMNDRTIEDAIALISNRDWQPKSHATYLGIVLSALVNRFVLEQGHPIITSGIEPELTLDLTPLNDRKCSIYTVPLNYVLYRFTGANVTVKGDVKDYFCDHAGPGTVKLQGIARDWACRSATGTHVTFERKVRDHCAARTGPGSIIDTILAGNYLARENRGAQVIAQWAGRRTAFRQSAGSVVIAMSAGVETAFEMRGGTVTAKDVGKDAARLMIGGTLDVAGDYSEPIGRGATGGGVILHQYGRRITYDLLTTPIAPSDTSAKL